MLAVFVNVKTKTTVFTIKKQLFKTLFYILNVLEVYNMTKWFSL